MKCTKSPNGTTAGRPPEQRPGPWLKLELEARSELHAAEIVNGARDGSETVLSECRIRDRETLMIESIEHLGAYLQNLALADRKLLGQRSVQVSDAVRA